MIVECLQIWIPRQRETLFRIVNECCQNTDFQYICSINEDAAIIISVNDGREEYKNIIQDNIIMELNDDDLLVNYLEYN